MRSRFFMSGNTNSLLAQNTPIPILCPKDILKPRCQIERQHLAGIKQNPVISQKAQPVSAMRLNQDGSRCGP